MEINTERSHITKEVLEILEEVVMDDSVYEMDPDNNLVEELDLDSMDLLDIAMEIKQRYKEWNLKIEREDYAHVRTLNDLVDFMITTLTKEQEKLNNPQTETTESVQEESSLTSTSSDEEGAKDDEQA